MDSEYFSLYLLKWRWGLVNKCVKSQKVVHQFTHIKIEERKKSRPDKKKYGLDVRVCRGLCIWHFDYSRSHPNIKKKNIYRWVIIYLYKYRNFNSHGVAESGLETRKNDWKRRKCLTKKKKIKKTEDTDTKRSRQIEFARHSSGLLPASVRRW